MASIRYLNSCSRLIDFRVPFSPSLLIIQTFFFPPFLKVRVQRHASVNAKVFFPALVAFGLGRSERLAASLFAWGFSKRNPLESAELPDSARG